MRHPFAAAATGLVLITGTMTGAAACSSTAAAPPQRPVTAAASSSPTPPPPADSHPPGDIPDSQVYVPWSPPGGGFAMKVPEGWARTAHGRETVFTDKFNSVRVARVQTSTALTVHSVRTHDVPALRAANAHFQLIKVVKVPRKGGTAVLAEYRADSAPNPVTGKRLALDSQRYVFYKAGRGEAVLTLSGPVGSDNVDPWRTVTNSFRWS